MRRAAPLAVAVLGLLEADGYAPSFVAGCYFLTGVGATSVGAECRFHCRTDLSRQRDYRHWLSDSAERQCNRPEHGDSQRQRDYDGNLFGQCRLRLCAIPGGRRSSWGAGQNVTLYSGMAFCDLD